MITDTRTQNLFLPSSMNLVTTKSNPCAKLFLSKVTTTTTTTTSSRPVLQTFPSSPRPDNRIYFAVLDQVQSRALSRTPSKTSPELRSKMKTGMDYLVQKRCSKNFNNFLLRPVVRSRPQDTLSEPSRASASTLTFPGNFKQKHQQQLWKQNLDTCNDHREGHRWIQHRRRSFQHRCV